jgi:tetratricopeptide (TPR) repeat protein
LFYLAPEQGENPSAVDQRADIYSLGVVCYEMLTGKVPVGKFSLPSQLNKALPPEIDAIVLKCLASDPAHRYPTVEAFLADLDRFEHDAGLALVSELKGLKRSTSRLLAQSRTGILRQKRTLAIGAGALVAVAALAMGASAWLSRRATVVPSPTAVDAPAASVPGTSEPPAAAPTASGAPAANIEPAPLSSTAISDTTALPTPVTPSGAPGAVTAPPAVPPAAGRAGRSDGPRPTANDAAGRALSAAFAKFETGQLDAALGDALAFLRNNPGHPRTVEAKLLAGRVREKQGRPSDAVALYEDVTTNHAGDPRSAEALVRHALILLSTPGKDLEARGLLVEALRRSPDGSSALTALFAKADIEEKRKMYERDPELGSSSPSALISYRAITERFPSAPDAEKAWWKVGELYESAKRFPQAAQAFVDLGTRFPETKLDTWFRAAELFDKRLDRPADARAAYLKVPASSAHYADARRRAAALSR